MKTIVLGFDGATMNLIQPGIERGELPAFALLVEEGAWGSLRSTVPPDSPSAWASFATGMEPGGHGVFGFMSRRPGEYAYDIGSSHAVRARTFWETAGEQGCRVGVINLPFTYPPRPVNGFVVSGMLTPDLQSPFAHPPELREELLREMPDYATTHGLGRMQGVDPREVLARDYAATIGMRERAMNWLRTKYQPDIFVCVFTVLDRLQHFLWADMDPKHPAHDPGAPSEYRDAIGAAYRLLDDVLGRVLDGADDDTLVVVCSDHGFEGVARSFYPNAWLAEQGLLHLTGEPVEPTEAERREAREARKALREAEGSEHEREKYRARRLRSDAFVRAIDWPRTRAWFGLDRGLWINLKGRDPEGAVEAGNEYEELRSDLICRLKLLIDPETKSRVVQRVRRREDVYSGRHLALAPDLVVEPARKDANPATRYTVSERLPAQAESSFAGSSAPISGNHTPDGILFVRGPGVSAGQRIEGARIVDLAPTILGAMGISPAEYMDARSLLVERDQERQSVRPEKPEVAQSESEGASAAITEAERRKIEDHLKNLGYLD